MKIITNIIPIIKFTLGITNSDIEEKVNDIKKVSNVILIIQL